MALRDLINSAAKSNNLDPELLARIVRIESGNNPYARTGSYHGLLQLNQPEFKRYNPTGDIYDPAANLNAGAAKLAGEIATFRQNYGREPTPTDIYMTHQQGQGGYAAHTANPNGAAWMNMANTAEGRQKGENWAKAAIWGNIPDQIKAQFPGGVNTVTSQDFVNIWRQKVEGANPQPPSPAVTYGQGETPALGTPAAPALPTPSQSVPSAPAAAPSGLGGLLARLVGAQPTLAPAAGLLGIPGQPPQGASASPPAGALSAYQPEAPPPLEMPAFDQLQFANQQPLRLARPQVKFGRGFY